MNHIVLSGDSNGMFGTDYIGLSRLIFLSAPLLNLYKIILKYLVGYFKSIHDLQIYFQKCFLWAIVLST